jgi:TPR repeat protein
MKIKHVLAAIWLMAIVAAPAIATPLQDAGNAYARGDFAIALQIWKPLADQGDSVAQKSLGRMYEAGRGVPQNAVEAAYWYRKAADQGNALAQLKLGVMSYRGNGVPQDYADALKWFRLVAGPNSLPTSSGPDKGNTFARFVIGMMYLNGSGVAQDFDEAAKWLGVVAYFGETGNTSSEMERLYRTEYDIVHQDRKEFYPEYVQVVRANYFVAVKVLGQLHAQGRGVPQDINQAMGLLNTAAQSGDAMAQFQLAQIYDAGPAALRNKAFAYFFYDLAAGQNYSGASDARDRVATTMSSMDRQLADTYRDTWRRKRAAK